MMGMSIPSGLSRGSQLSNDDDGASIHSSMLAGLNGDVEALKQMMEDHINKSLRKQKKVFNT